MKKLKTLALIGAFTLAGCATTAKPTSTNLTNFGYEVANYLQLFNTGLQAVLPTADVVIAAISKQDSTVTKDQNYVAVANTILTATNAALSTAKQVELSNTQAQAAVSAVLAPTTVATVVANVTTP